MGEIAPQVADDPSKVDVEMIVNSLRMGLVGSTLASVGGLAAAAVLPSLVMGLSPLAGLAAGAWLGYRFSKHQEK
ncbi:hypothetical protein BH10PSE4_BH10PSE4_20770 [soil metagenome]